MSSVFMPLAKRDSGSAYAEEGEREVEVVDVAERLADVDDGAALGGARIAASALLGKRDVAKEAAEEPAQDRAGPLDHGGVVGLANLPR